MAALATITVGTVEGDNTGEHARTAFVKINSAITSLSNFQNISSDLYGLVGDGTTDNNTAITNWIAAANTAIGAGSKVRMTLLPGVYSTTGSHVFPGAADWFAIGDAKLLAASGGSVTTPFCTFGENTAVANYGCVHGFFAMNARTHLYTNPLYIAAKFINKNATSNYIKFIEGFHTCIQLMADSGNCSYNTFELGDLRVARYGVHISVADSSGTPFTAQNTFKGGNIEATTSMNNFGNIYGVVFDRRYDSGYALNSGNFFYGTSFQLSGTPLAYPTSAAPTVNRRYLESKLGAEWLCKATTGNTSGTNPTTIPSGANLVTATSITAVAGNAQISFASTTGISAGWHVRFINPNDNFPIDTYVASVDDSTHVTLTNNAVYATTTGKATFTAPVTDGSSTMVYLGPFARWPVWLRDSATSNGLRDCRAEGGYGGTVGVTGPNIFPETSSGAGFFNAQVQTTSQTAVNRVREAKWATGTVYALGDRVQRAAFTGKIWECVTAGTSHASTEPTIADTDGTTGTDNTVTWKALTAPDSTQFGSVEAITGGAQNLKVTVSSPFYQSTSDVTIDNLMWRGIGSATGWRVVGMSRCGTGSTSTSEFTTAPFALARDGLIVLSGTEFPCVIVRSDKQKAFRVRKHFGAFSASRMYVVPLDANYKRLCVSTTNQAYYQRLHGNFAPNGANTYNEGSDTVGPLNNIYTGAGVANIAVGIAKGSNPCTLSGITIAALPTVGDSLTGFVDGGVQLGNPYVRQFMGMRSSLGAPTIGVFWQKGEYIENGSLVTGNTVPKGYYVTTVGLMAPAYANSTAYIKGQLMSVAGQGVYAANGTFTSAASGTTGPTGVNANILEAGVGATSITAGDSATWDYIGPIAVCTADENMP